MKKYSNYQATNIQEVCSIAGELNINITSEQARQLEEYYKYLKEINRQFNLTRLIEPVDFWTFHVLDTVFLISLMNKSEGGRLLDFGSGCGVPGILINILKPELNITLCESVGKKAKFLENCIEKLNLKNIQVINDRVENINKNFDFITARAVAQVPKIFNLVKPLLSNTNNKIKKSKSKNINKSNKFLMQTTKPVTGDIKQARLLPGDIIYYELSDKPRYITVVS